MLRAITASFSSHLQVFKSFSNGTPTNCRCHGVSASCGVKTCYKPAPSIQTVTAYLKLLYQRSCKVYSNQLHGNQHAYISNCTKRAPQDNELVYLESSPNYCFRDLARGSLGVSGRLCKLEPASSPGSCNHLCCGRGRVSKKVSEEIDCDCRFVWCCKIDCKKCVREKTQYHCK